MRIIFCGHDAVVGALERCLGRGHGLAAVWTTPPGASADGNAALLAVAARLRIPVSFHPPGADDLAACAADADVLVSAGYPHRIPEVAGLRGINLHPTLLPEGRGPSPFEHLVLARPEAAGLTIHRLTAAMDRGAVLARRAFPLDGQSDLDEILGRVKAAALDLLPAVLDDFDRLWDAAEPQGTGSDWPPVDLADLAIDPALSIAEIRRRIRCWPGGAGYVVVGPQGAVAVTSVSAWEEPHGHAPGTVVDDTGPIALVAAKDGWLAVRGWRA